MTSRVNDVTGSASRRESNSVISQVKSHRETDQCIFFLYPCFRELLCVQMNKVKTIFGIYIFESVYMYYVKIQSCIVRVVARWFLTQLTFLFVLPIPLECPSLRKLSSSACLSSTRENRCFSRHVKNKIVSFLLSLLSSCNGPPPSHFHIRDNHFT